MALSGGPSKPGLCQPVFVVVSGAAQTFIPSSAHFIFSFSKRWKDKKKKCEYRTPNSLIGPVPLRIHRSMSLGLHQTIKLRLYRWIPLGLYEKISLRLLWLMPLNLHWSITQRLYHAIPLRLHWSITLRIYRSKPLRLYHQQHGDYMDQ